MISVPSVQGAQVAVALQKLAASRLAVSLG